MAETCPKCGAPRLPNLSQVVYECHSAVRGSCGFGESPTCLRRQLSRLAAERDIASAALRRIVTHAAETNIAHSIASKALKELDHEQG